MNVTRNIVAIFTSFIKRLFYSLAYSITIDGNGASYSKNLFMCLLDQPCSVSDGPGFPQPLLDRTSAWSNKGPMTTSARTWSAIRATGHRKWRQFEHIKPRTVEIL